MSPAAALTSSGLVLSDEQLGELNVALAILRALESLPAKARLRVLVLAAGEVGCNVTEQTEADRNPQPDAETRGRR